MALKLYNDTDVQNIANAIRAKNGSSDTYKVSQMSSAINALQNGAYNIEATIDGDFQTLDITDYDYTPTTPTPTASATATSGVTYTHILNKLTFEQINRYAKAISNASDITSSTSDVYITDGNNNYVLSIGDTICYTLSTNEVMVDQIIGFNHDTLTTATAYGEATTTGKAGITFQMENLLNTNYPMNDTDTNAGGWGDSSMRATTLPAVKLTMPAGLQSVIKYVNKKAADGGSTNYTTTETLSDDLFLLAEIEMFTSSSLAQDGGNEGTTYKYWSVNTDADKIKFNDTGTGIVAWFYWLRSCRATNTGNFCDVGKTGSNGHSSADSVYGVSFAYCI